MEMFSGVTLLQRLPVTEKYESAIEIKEQRGRKEIGRERWGIYTIRENGSAEIEIVKHRRKGNR